VEKIGGGRLKVERFTMRAHVHAVVRSAGFERHTFFEAPFYFQSDLKMAAPQPLPDGCRGSLAEPWADTTSPAGRGVLAVFAGIAEFERALIHQHASAGRSAARTKGVRFGRPPALRGEQIALGHKLLDKGQ
jgi:hypothetical protein